MYLLVKKFFILLHNHITEFTIEMFDSLLFADSEETEELNKKDFDK